MSNQMAPVVLGVLSLVGGLTLGWVGHNMLSEPEIIEKEITKIEKEEITDEELLALCETLSEEEKRDVLGVAQEVLNLQEQLSEKEAELERLQSESELDEVRQAAAREKWKEMEQEIATLRVQLASAVQERDELKVELQETLVQLDEQIQETRKFKTKAKRYKKESIDNLWSSFIGEAKLAGCKRGTTRRHEKCYEAFDQNLVGALEERFKTCVHTHQAVPVLRKAERGDSLPNFSEWLSSENKFTKNWYVIFCDPTLPEAEANEFE